MIGIYVHLFLRINSDNFLKVLSCIVFYVVLPSKDTACTLVKKYNSYLFIKCCIKLNKIIL
ncbi:hypothetical protein COL05_22175 [Bacillus sp. AFS059628]|nr:hypothetical protein COL05_22175 [Bacillus sp. AFS059628]